MLCTKMPLDATSTQPVIDFAIAFAIFALASFVKIHDLESLIAAQLAMVASWALEANRLAGS